MEDTKVSIIVPVYNVEEYLKECIESIINQTHKNLEIILINDGSTDNSLNICKYYETTDSRVKVIDKINEGLSEARNTGVRHSTGEYLIFVDSDDFINEDMVEYLLNILIINKGCIAQCSFKRFSSTYSIEENLLQEEIKVMNNIEALESMHYVNGVDCITWNKIYKKHLFEEIKFPIGKIHEDNFTTYKLVDITKKIIVTDRILYYYRQREGSIMNESFNIKKLDAIEACTEKMNYFINKGYKKLIKLSMKELQNKLINSYFDVYSSDIINKNIYLDDIYKNIKENYLRFLFNEYSDILPNIAMTILIVNRKLFCHLYKILRR